MRNSLQFLVVTLLFLVPFTILAQQPIETIQIPNFSLRSDSVNAKSNFNIATLLPLKSETQLAFAYHFKSFSESKRLNSEQPDITPNEYNMPIVTPGKTSKILIAKNDPNFPYSYKMPVLKE